jgi:hypothetical protein
MGMALFALYKDVAGAPKRWGYARHIGWHKLMEES